MLQEARRKKIYLKEFCCYLDDKRLPIDDGRYHYFSSGGGGGGGDGFSDEGGMMVDHPPGRVPLLL